MHIFFLPNFPNHFYLLILHFNLRAKTCLPKVQDLRSKTSTTFETVQDFINTQARMTENIYLNSNSNKRYAKVMIS